MKIDMADNTALLGSMESSMGMLTTGFSVLQLKMSEALTKLDVVRKGMPMAIGYCWGPEPPILLLDGLGRKTSLPMMLASSPDVRVNTAYVIVLSEVDLWRADISRHPFDYASRRSWLPQNRKR